MITYKDYLNKITLDEIIQHYEVENRTVTEACEYFNISQAIFMRILKHYNFHKSKDAHVSQIKKSKLEKYGDENYNNQIKRAETNIDKYGVDNQFKREDIKEKITDIKLEKYGNLNNINKNHETRIKNSGSLKASYKNQQSVYKDTRMKKYGTTNAACSEEVKEKIKETLKKTFNEKYGADNYWCTEYAKRSYGSKHSSYNKNFKLLLEENNIEYTQEFLLSNKWYDFKIGNTLIEINPSATHNANWSPYSSTGLDINYHNLKSLNAKSNGYNCIHIWDWEDQNKIIYFLKPRETIYARKCIIKLVDRCEAVDFINKYHFQNYARDTIRIGLYYNDKLISIMTFCEPRYNKKFDYELIRYCSSANVVGGAERLFNYFIKNYNPKSIISYCDKSKFTGQTYLKLGFKLARDGKPTRHWYNIHTCQHILDSLLRYRGFDQIFKTNYGKGSNNYELMLLNGFVEVYDCGQNTYTLYLK